MPLCPILYVEGWLNCHLSGSLDWQVANWWLPCLSETRPCNKLCKCFVGQVQCAHNVTRVRFYKNAGIMRVCFKTKCGYYVALKTQKWELLNTKMRVLWGFNKVNAKTSNLFKPNKCHHYSISYNIICFRISVKENDIECWFLIKGNFIFNRPGVAGAVLQTPPWFIHSFINSVILCGNIFKPS